MLSIPHKNFKTGVLLWLLFLQVIPLGLKAKETSTPTNSISVKPIGHTSEGINDGDKINVDKNDWDDSSWDDWEQAEQTTTDGKSSAIAPITGYVEIALGQRFKRDTVIKQKQTLGDIKLHLNWQHLLTNSLFDGSRFISKADIYYDQVQASSQIDIRELSWQTSLHKLGQQGQNWDLKMGKQMLTWGVGHYVFINDHFAKDWQSFFAGRDDNNLKLASTAVRLSGYYSFANIDLVWLPKMQADHYINGEIFSFYSGAQQQNIAPRLTANQPSDGELAIRLSKQIGSNDIAIYGFDGYSKSPEAIDFQGKPAFYKIRSLGASLISPLANGLFKSEYGYHDHSQNSPIENQFISLAQSNQQWLIGYEQEIKANLSLALQFHWRNAIGNDTTNQNRKQITVNTRWQNSMQTLTVDWFQFYELQEHDNYSRLTMHYQPNDQWHYKIGLNHFLGKPETFFGQFENASNYYASIQYLF
ncbi:hypothetical protein C2869_16590 [Saccharobesus litoralis]|uniref:Alginate export domain-containing protein n=1 Tax=Saccharobesus litoralis TaxID=2172099 RepID=A0A2S0VUP3_9ALTE|nr:hypothetical protein [Saccharobesus litoralis]AWB67941.1 hypothetical protein C2869_16590 [Saccharobesus litoralis]